MYDLNDNLIYEVTNSIMSTVPFPTSPDDLDLYVIKYLINLESVKLSFQRLNDNPLRRQQLVEKVRELGSNLSDQ